MESAMVKNILGGGPILVAIVFMFMMWMKDKKHKVTNDELLVLIKSVGGKISSVTEPLKELLLGKIDEHDRIVKIQSHLYSIEKVVVRTWEAHDQKDADGVYVWHLRASWLKQQEDIEKVLIELKDVIKDVHNGQRHQTEVLTALVDKIKT